MLQWTDSQRAAHQITQLVERMAPFIHQDMLCQLPYEIASRIIRHLNRSSLMQASLVNKAWHALCNEPTVYKTLFENEGWEYDTEEMQAYLKIQPMPIQRGKQNPQRQPMNWKRLYQNRFKIEQRWLRGDCLPRLFPPPSHLGPDLHTEGIYCSQFDKHRIVTGSRDQTIKIWDPRSGKCLNTIRAHCGSVLCLQYDATHIVSGSSDATVAITDMRTAVVRYLRGHDQSVLGVRWVQTDKVVSCSKDEQLRLWDRSSGQCLRVMTGHRAAVNAVQWHDTRIVSASGDRTLKVWEVESGVCTQTLRGHTRGVACVEFDGQRIISGSSDHTIRIWDVDTGTCTQVIMGHTELVRSLQFNPLLNRIVSGCYNGHLKVWDLNQIDLEHNLQQVSEGRIFNIKFDFSKIVCCSSLAKLVVYDYAYDIDTRFLK